MAGLEFWGVEVKPGQKIICQPGDERFIHLSQAALGELKDAKAKSVRLFVNFEGSKFVIGTLSSKSCPQIAYDVVFQKEFELSHSWKDGSVFFIGYKTQFENGGSEEDSDSDSEAEMSEFVSHDDKANGNLISKTEKPVVPVHKKVVTSMVNTKPVEPNKDGLDSDDEASEDASDEGSDDREDDDDSNKASSDNDGNDDSDDDSTDEEEKITLKAETSKKRTADSKHKAPKKKVKLVTPSGKNGINDGKKKSPYTVTPYPTTKQTSKSAAKPQISKSIACKSCSRCFNSENALQSHTKAKHGQ